MSTQWAITNNSLKITFLGIRGIPLFAILSYFFCYFIAPFPYIQFSYFYFLLLFISSSFFTLNFKFLFYSSLQFTFGYPCHLRILCDLLFLIRSNKSKVSFYSVVWRIYLVYPIIIIWSKFIGVSQQWQNICTIFYKFSWRVSANLFWRMDAEIAGTSLVSTSSKLTLSWSRHCSSNERGQPNVVRTS